MNLIHTFALKQLTQTQVCVYVGLVWCVLSVCVCVCVCVCARKTDRQTISMLVLLMCEVIMLSAIHTTAPSVCVCSYTYKQSGNKTRLCHPAVFMQQALILTSKQDKVCGSGANTCTHTHARTHAHTQGCQPQGLLSSSLACWVSGWWSPETARR